MGKRHVVVPAVAGAAALALVAGVGVASAMQTNDVVLTVDGAASTLSVREHTVEDLLAREGIELGAHDVVLPAEDTELTDGLEVTVRHAKPLSLTVDGQPRKVWTTARNVGEALGYLQLDARDSLVSTSRSAAIGRDGIRVDVVTAKDVTLVAGGTETPVRLAGTVGDLLRHRGITADADDKVSHETKTPLTDGMRVTFVDVQVSRSTKDVPVAFDKRTERSDTLDKGEERVTTKGVDGLARETWTTVRHDGAVVSSKRTATTTVKEPVTEVTTVGTRETPEPSPTPSASPSPSTDADKQQSDEDTPSTPTPTGGKADWMRAAGIPEDQWRYVDYIVSRESGWNPSARNPSTGACGLVQAYPCSKLGSNWRDPVHALKWQYSYVSARYGGYQGAYVFWKRNSWY